MPGTKPGLTQDAKEAIRIGDKVRDWREATRWGFLLAAFMRIVAVLWLFQGLLRWSDVLMPAHSIFDLMTADRAASTVFFSVTNLVAAVGLWLATPWGGVLWLVVVAAESMMTFVMPDFFAAPRLTLAVDVVLVITYFVLTWYAARERDGV
jgi:hypothetical protein